MTRIAYQGVPGAYSELAARALYPNAKGVPLATFAGVIQAVTTGKARFGILPIRNSIIGPVPEAEAALQAERGVVVVQELSFHIQHCLLALPGADLTTIRWVESHPVALVQCAGWLAAQGLTGRPVADTAGAARNIAADRDYHRAAIAGIEAAAQYGLDVLAEGIADAPDNRTLFVVVEAAEWAAAA